MLRNSKDLMPQSGCESRRPESWIFHRVEDQKEVQRSPNCSDTVTVWEWCRTAQRQRRGSPPAQTSADSSSDRVRSSHYFFTQFLSISDILLGIQQIIFRKLLLNNTSPQLLHRFSCIGFFQGHFSKNNGVMCCVFISCSVSCFYI